MESNREIIFWKKVFWGTCLLSIGIKLLIAMKIPLTGDEAYYIQWSKYPALGYFDQPPMIAWILSGMRFFGTSPWILRLPSVFMPSFLAPLLVDLLDRFGRGKGSVDLSRNSSWTSIAGILFLIAPIHLFFPILSTDLPLILFSFLSFYFFTRSLLENRNLFAGVGGLFFGLAFLSKYFVLLLGVSFLVYGCIYFKERKVWKKLMLGILAFLPFLALHIFWNINHCWINFFFNTSVRNIDEKYNLDHFFEFIKFQLFLLGPVGVYFSVRSLKRVIHVKKTQMGLLGGLSFLIPIFAFGVSSFHYRQGLHWTLSFYPYFYLVFALLVKRDDLRSALRLSVLWSTLCAFCIAILMSQPVERWRSYYFYRGLKFYLAAPALSRVLESYRGEFELASDGYTEAALLESYMPGRVHVFGEGVVFGREDDFLTDWRTLERKNILIFTRHGREKHEFEPYFESVERIPVELDGHIYHVLLGRHLNFPAYRDRILARIARTYYPQGCSIIGRYF